jgi:hypothetical protein
VRRERDVSDEQWRVDRRAHLWQLHDFTRGRGLEIGPLHAPVVTKDAADVFYVDVFDRAELVRRYRDDPFVDVADIPVIDFSLNRGSHFVSLVEAVKAAAPVSWVFASHVVEHVPDVIGWLRDLGEIVEYGGVLVLAIPDRRYCFDVFRPQTTLGQMLQAYTDKDVRPTVRAVFDSLRDKVEVDTSALWRGELPVLETARLHTLDEVMSEVERVRDGDYVDAHVWTFTPDSFADQLGELEAMGLGAWHVEHIEAPQGAVEFYARLRRTRRSMSETPLRRGS